MEKQSLLRLRLALDRFVSVWTADSERAHQHCQNLTILQSSHDEQESKMQHAGRRHALRKELANAARTLQQMQGHLLKLRELRLRCESSDLPTLDRLLKHKVDVVSVDRLLREFAQLLSSVQSNEHSDDSVAAAATPVDEATDDRSAWPQMQQQVAADAQIEGAFNEALAWEQLALDLEHVNTAMHQMQVAVLSAQDPLSAIETNVESAESNVAEGARQLTWATQLKYAWLPVSCAAAGGLVAGPAGFFMAAKLGAMVAAVVGGSAGAVIGTRVRQRTRDTAAFELQQLHELQEKRHED